MSVLRNSEAERGRMLTVKEIVNLVRKEMKIYDIAVEFVPWKWK
jgi:hypothetical protein